MAVDRSDLVAAPVRYVGHALLLRSDGCRYIDVNSYVCVAAGTPGVEIYATVIMPPPAQVAIEAGIACREGRAEGRGKGHGTGRGTGRGTGGRAVGEPRCGRVLRFVPAAARRKEDGTAELVTPAIWVGSRSGRSP